MKSLITIEKKYKVKLKDGYTISEELNETLDSGEATFSLNQSLDIEPFDDILFDYAEGEFRSRQKIDSVQNDITNPFENNEIHTYILKTFSETKLLERITCPNLSITQSQKGYFTASMYQGVISGTAEEGFIHEGDEKTFNLYAPALIDNIATGIYEYSGEMICYLGRLNASDFIKSVSWDEDGNVVVVLKIPTGSGNMVTYNFAIGIRYKRSIYYYIKLYCDLYAPKIYVSDDQENVDLVSSIKISDAVKNRFKNIECPEFHWDNPTLREVLNDLMMVDNCIVTLKNNCIDFIDLKKTGNKIDKSKLNGISKSQTSADYCSELTLPMSNSIGKQLVKKEEWITFRNSSEAELTEDNLQLETKFPIYKIENIIMSYVAYLTPEYYSGVNQCLQRDITAYIYEEKVWNTLPSPTLSNWGAGTKFWAYKYKRGSNIIDGFSQRYQYVLSNKLSIKSFIEEQQLVINGNEIQTIRLKENVRDIRFKVSYYTIDDRKLHIGKYLPTKHAENRVFDTQTSSYVDPNKMSMFEYFKANRLGNAITTITGSYANVEAVPKLGDELDGEILFSRKLKLNDDVVQFEGYLTKNYILQDYFTSVQAKRRSWAWVDSDEAHIRYDVEKYFLEFSYKNKYDLKPTHYFVNYAENGNQILPEYYFLSPFYSYTNGCLMENVFVKAYGMNRADCTAEQKFYWLDLSVEKMGNSLVATFGFNDNISAGTFINYQEQGNNKYWLNDFYKYADEYAETYALDYYITNQQDEADGEFAWINEYEQITGGPMGSELAGDWENGLRQTTEKCQKRPLATALARNYNFTPMIVLQNRIHISKDNAEIVKISNQFEFCSDTEDIVFGSLFLENNKMIRNSSYDASNLRFVFNERKPSLTNLNRRPTGSVNTNTSLQTLTIDVVDNCVTFNFNSDALQMLNFRKVYYAYIFDPNQDNRVLLAFKLKRSTHYYQDSTYKIYLNALKTRDCNIYDSVEDRNIIGDLVNGIYEEE